MLDDLRFGVAGLALPGGGKITDQAFADDTTLYLQGTRENMERTQKVLDTFCKASGAKVNWNKSCTIWASKREKDWEWGREVGLQWIPKGKGVRYLGIQVGFHLPPEANFDKMLSALKRKLINWSTCRLSLAGRILVANQVLLASMWYLAAAWNPNPMMCNQVRGVVRNFIWSGKAANTRAKVKWETLMLRSHKEASESLTQKLNQRPCWPNSSLGALPREGNPGRRSSDSRPIRPNSRCTGWGRPHKISTGYSRHPSSKGPHPPCGRASSTPG
jgi:hypothetical protein